MSDKALIIVDVQNDFCPGGNLAVPNGNEVVALLNRMIEHAKNNGWLVVASGCQHPEVTSHFKKDGGIWPVHCVRGTHGAQFHPDLNIKDAIVVSKGMNPAEDGYSAFDGSINDGKFLKALLNDYDISEVYVGGLATDYCVKATAIAAIDNGFQTILLLDASRAVNINPDDGERSVEEMRVRGVAILTIEEVIGG